MLAMTISNLPYLWTDKLIPEMKKDLHVSQRREAVKSGRESRDTRNQE
jgi:hypothetical protein